MSLESHLTELVRRHQAMDSAIALEEQHPSVDDVKLHEMKRKRRRTEASLREFPFRV